MATLQQLETALRNADKAGDVDAARQLAAEITRMRQAEQAPQPSPREAFDALPWYMKVAQAADDTARNFANTVTFGMADRLAGALGGEGVEAERAKSDAAAERAGSAKIATDVLALAAPASAASRAVGSAIPALSGTGALATAAREGIVGSGIGGLMAGGHGENVAEGLLLGGIGGAAGGLAGKYLGEGIDWASSKLGVGKGILSSERIPRLSLDEQQAAKNAAYQNLDQSGIMYSPNDAAGLVQETRRRLGVEGIDRDLHPRATRTMQLMQRRLGGNKPASIGAVDSMRQLINRDVVGEGGETAMRSVMRNSIDDFINNTTPLGGGTAQARELVGAARNANRQLEVRRGVEKAVEKMRNSARGEGNIGPFRSLLDKGTEGMSKREADLLRNIVRGEGWEEALSRSLVGTTAKLGSFGSGAAAGGIATGGNPIGVGVGGLSALVLPPLAKRGARKYVQKNIEALLDELGGGVFNPSLLRALGQRTGGGIGGGMATEREAKRKRKYRKDKD